MDDQTLIDSQSNLQAICQRKDLFEGVQTVSHAVSGRSTLPILSHIHIQSMVNSLRLIATDMEISISLDIPARVQDPGAITAPAKFLAELLGTFPEDDITLQMEPNHSVSIHCDRSDYVIPGLPAEEYPRLPEVPDTVHFTIQQKVLKDVIRKTIFAVSIEETRPILKGILINLSYDCARFVATDTHRLAIRKVNLSVNEGDEQPVTSRVKLSETTGEEFHNAIVPARALNELQRILLDEPGEVMVCIAEGQIQFTTPNGIKLIAKLIEGQFPNYERVIPESHTRKLTLQTVPMQQAVRRASFVAREDANRIVLQILDDELEVSANSSLGQALEKVEAIREGDDVKIAFNSKYVMDMLGVLDSDGFLLEITEQLKPAIIRPVIKDEKGDPNDYICILMPMQIV